MLSLLNAGTTDAKRRHGRPIVCRSQKGNKKMKRYDMMHGRIRLARHTQDSFLVQDGYIWEIDVPWTND
jgi:hypothetical protein